MLPLLLTTLAGLAAPTVSVDADGTVRGVLVVDASPEAVHAALEDGAALAASSPEVRHARATHTGACERLDIEVKGLFSPFRVETLRCPTDDGWTERLVRSGTFTAWSSRWSATPLADGRTRVDYAVHTELDLPVPRALLRQRTQRSVAISLDALAARAEAHDAAHHDATASSDTATPDAG